MELTKLETITQKYNGNVEKLLALGMSALDLEDFSYIRDIGLDENDKEQLMQLALDKELYDYVDEKENEVFCGVLHAWRALSELKIPEVKELFQALLIEGVESNDDWKREEFIFLIAPYRAGMFQEASRYVLDDSCNEWVRVEYIVLIEDMIKNNEVEHSDVDTLLVKLFEECNNPMVNAFAISLCMDYSLTQHYNAIAKCHENDLVDLGLRGDLENVEIAFGMRTQRETPRPISPMIKSLQTMTEELIKGLDRQATLPVINHEPKIERNSPCPCGSGKKYKKCCNKSPK